MILKVFYLFFSISLILTGIMTNLNIYYFLLIFIAISQMFLFQIRKVNIDDANNCLNIFKSNNFLGLIIFLAIIIGKIQ